MTSNSAATSIPEQPMILGFDPGRHRCGLAVMGVDRTLRYHQVVEAKDVLTTLQTLQERFPISLIVMGDQTTAQTWKQQLSEQLTTAPNIVMVDERYSTLAARDRYWQMYPARGLYRLVPKGMRVPPRSLDDIVAILLIERYLEQLVSP
ncbi:MAG: pre-16S rRNA-processing nuclease YqgF [Leptolyngbyaceae cyanobacterium bins.59]|nr:pre-16S rRNA-processing nuclease YqgF [Leptolyngbyaceae cyanobacterium bins.59]